MKLPVLPFLNKKPKEDFFISLLFKPKNTVAILLSNKESSLNIISTKSVSLDLESASTEEIIAVADEAISSIELSLDEGYKLEKTIFSVPYFWADEDGSIKKEKLLQLKKLSVELALKPMGFIVSIEALIKYFQDKEGVPLSAIFVEETKDKVYLYLVKAGSIVEVQSGQVTDEIEKSVEHALKKVEKFTSLPSRMILLYHDDIENRQQNFLNYPWTKDLPFLHLPQISLMEKGFENEAVVDAIASQLNARILDKPEISGAELIENEASSMADEDEKFGFVKEKDVFDIPEDEHDREKVIVSVSGAYREDDIKIKDDRNFDEESEKNSNSTLDTVFELPGKVLGIFGGFVSGGSKLKAFFIPIAAVIIFAFLMVIYYLLFLRVEVVVFIDGEVVKDEVLVNLSEEENTSFEDQILRIDTIEQEVEGKVFQNTTGIEETGEKAKGEATISSSLSQSQTIESGTVLTSSNGLKFTLDDDVDIASSSGVTDLKTKKGKVTADEIGKEYNLPSGTKFSVSGFDNSSVEAKNDAAFSGGTKEEKQIVSKDDTEKLAEKIVEDLFDKALEQARKSVESNEQIISVLLSSSIENEKYNASIGDEIKSLELTATVFYVFGVYKKEEAQKFINDSKGGQPPEGFVISEEDSEISLTDVQQTSAGITGMLTYEVLYKPNIELANLADKIAGKTSSAALEIIKKIDGISDATIVFKNKLPLLPSILPARSGQINISLKTASR